MNHFLGIGCNSEHKQLKVSLLTLKLFHSQSLQFPMMSGKKLAILVFAQEFSSTVDASIKQLE